MERVNAPRGSHLKLRQYSSIRQMANQQLFFEALLLLTLGTGDQEGNHTQEGERHDDGLVMGASRGC